MGKLLGVDCSFNCFDVGGIIAADMEPGALRRRLDDIYLHRRERPGLILSAVHEHASPNLAETQPMSVEICFRLSIWPLQQLLASPAAECPS